MDARGLHIDSVSRLTKGLTAYVQKTIPYQSQTRYYIPVMANVVPIIMTYSSGLLSLCVTIRARGWL
jgi:hypothetical protein